MQAATQPQDTIEPLRPPRTAPLVGRRVMAVMGGGAAAVAVAAVTAAQVATAPVRLTVAAVVFLVVPTSRELSRRVLIAGCVLLGWVPMTWWWRLPVGKVGHAGLLIAVTVGGLMAWLMWSGTGRKARALLPRVRLTDLWLLGAAAVTAWINEPRLLTAPLDVVTSRMLFQGWDNVSHYNITEMIRRYGVMIIHAPAPLHGDWTYGAYPQGFHAVAATVMEALIGVRVGDPIVELAAYVHALTLVAVLAVTTVVAGVCSIPALRRRPLLALPLVAFVVATFGLGPGGLVLHNGFPNYFVAVAMLCCIPIIAVQSTRPASLPMLCALSGALMAIAHNWALLLVVGAFGLVAFVFPWRRSRWPSSVQGWIPAGLVTFATAVGGMAAWSLLQSNPSLGSIIVIKGGISQVPISAIVLTTALAVAASVIVGLRVHRAASTRHGDEAVRVGWLVLVPVGGFVLVALVAATQILERGDVSYYFWKVAIALQIVSAVALCCAVPFIVPRTGSVHVTWSGVVSGAGRALVSVVVAAAAFQAYGAWHVFPTQLGGQPAPGIEGRQADEALGVTPLLDARYLIDAVRATSGNKAPAVFAVPSPTAEVDGMLLAQWYYALTGTWTTSNDALLRQFRLPNGANVVEVTRTARNALASGTDVVVVVEPAMVGQVRAALGPVEADRVLSW